MVDPSESPMPPHLKKLEAILTPLARLPASIERHPELELAITRGLKPTGWWSDDAWGRAKLDLVVTNPKKKDALLFDWKFGKNQSNTRFLQLHIATWMFFLHTDTVEKVSANLLWVKHRKLEGVNYQADLMRPYESAILDKVNRMEEAVEKKKFPAKENFLCRKWCPVTTCKYNGNFKR